MSINRRLAAVGAIAALAFAGTGSAFAATPQMIYRDLVDNGKLDGHYTRAEIARAFDLPPNVGTDPGARVPRKPIGVQAEGVQAAPATKRSNRRLPFSSLDVALLVAGGGPLLLIAASLKRRAAEPRSEPSVAGG